MKRILLIAFPILNSLFVVAQGQQNTMSQSVQKIVALSQIVDAFYVDIIDEERITESAIRKMLAEMDPHSVYIPADELKQVNEPLVGKFEGIGIQFNILNDTIMVTNTIPGGPSEKLGIRSGDRIVRINDTTVAGIKIKNSDVLKKLRGDKGTKVKVDIYRRGVEETLEYVITRDKIPLFSVDSKYMITPETGYIKISRFADSTVEEFREALTMLKEKGMKNLILDLQSNGGGYLNRAIELADEFLSQKKLIVYTEGRAQAKQESYSTATGGWEKGKLCVLIDETSASASEIVSGAVQDWDRGLIIGRRSFGKGLVQKPYGLPDGSAVRLTIARYHTPSGRCIQKAYDKGDEEYDLDFANRLKSGELFYADSIPHIDSLKVFTNNKRPVFGGGGIIPDVFVPIDTSFNSSYYRDLQRKSLFNQFCLTYVDNNRKELFAKYPDIETFKTNYVLTDSLFNAFIDYAEKNEVKKDEAGIKTSEQFIRLVLKALIAQDMWNVDAYFQVINEINRPVQKALQCIQDKTFEKNKIASN